MFFFCYLGCCTRIVCFFLHNILCFDQNESFDTMVKLLSRDHDVTDSSYGNNFLQYKVKLCIIDTMWSDFSLESLIGGSFVHRVPFIFVF